MNQWKGQVAFVTGASAGIGKTISIKLVEYGLKVVGFARRKELLEELAKQHSNAKGRFYPCTGDVSKEEDILKALQWTKNNIGPVSILINNAGILRPTKLAECQAKELKQIYEVNVFAPCIATRKAIKHMKESKVDGHIININSVAGHKILPFPQIGLYSSTKHALTTLTENLRLELASEKSNIKVTSISPGSVRTDMTSKAVDEKKITFVLEAEDVANAVVYALSTPPTVNITELTIQPVGEQF